MNPERWQKVKEIFNQALETPVVERDKFLLKCCGDDGEMRQEIEKMLVFAASDDDTLEENVFEILTGGKNDALPEKIGVYKILREIGRGGMGLVYEAVRETKDFKQKVALKVIKRGMDTDAILSRFRHEQQILATLVHPNIARFVDGGMTPEGQAFYAMEYVEGVPLDAFAEEQNLSINERLVLFRQVCSAVQFAHKNFVIHRDLKPSNILVMADGTPKLLDFGIGKILSDDLDANVGTATALGMMTPAYASPEQVRGLRVNTATDIYSLGVILCELLTGQKPYRLNFNNQPELIKAICESEPLKPSEAVSESKRSKDNLDETDAKSPSFIQNAQSLRGDLDNIVLKALRKEPENRYASVEQFSEDIHRYLTGLPIMARPSTLKYRASKFIHRNRLAVVAGALIFVSLIAGIAVASWQAYVARRERAVAERRFDDVRQLANNVVFKYHDAIASLSGATAVREMLVKDATEYLDKLSLDAQDNPTLAQELALSYLKIGNVQGETYRANLGDSEGAVSSYRKSAELLEELTKTYPKNIEYRKNLREAYQQLAYILVRREDWKEAEEMANRQFELAKYILAQDPENIEYQIMLARSFQVVGDTVEFSGGHTENIRLFRLSLAEAEKLIQKNPSHEPGRRVLTVALQRLGTRLEYYANYLEEKGSSPAEVQPLYVEAEQLHRRTVEISEGLRRDFPQNEIYKRYVSAAGINFGTALARIGRGAEGIPMIEKALDILKQSAAADPKNAEAKRDVAECWQYLAFAYAAMNENEKAVNANEESLKLLEEITAADPSNFEFLRQTHLTYNNTGDILFKENRISEALSFYQKGLVFSQKMSAANKSPQIAVLQSISNQKIGQAFLRLAQENKSSDDLKAARENLSRAREELLALRNRNELGRNYEFKIDLLDRELAKASAL